MIRRFQSSSAAFSGSYLMSGPRAGESPDMSSELQRVAQVVVSRARQKGYVVSRDVRQELTQAGHPATRWKEVIRAAGKHLEMRNGRYYYVSRVRVHMREEQRSLNGVKRATQNLIRQYKAAAVATERRSHRRIHFILPVTVILADGKKVHVVTQDISLNGVRVIASVDLRGQKAQVVMPSIDHGTGQWVYSVHFLWSSKIGDNLIESGGFFLDVAEAVELGDA